MFKLVMKAAAIGVGAWVGSYVALNYVIKHQNQDGSVSGFLEPSGPQKLGLDDAAHTLSMGLGAIAVTKLAAKFMS